MIDYRAVGDPVTVASHLLQAAEPGTILIGEATSRAVQGVMRVETVEPLRVAGRREPIVASRLLGARATHV
jgi:class 3 adenylate cyclase